MSPTSSTKSTGEPSPWSVPFDIAEPTGRLQRITDVEEAVDAITRTYQPGRLEIADSSRPLGMEIWSSALPGLRLNYLSYGTDVAITAPPMERYVLCVPIAGQLRIGSASTQVEASAQQFGAAISPGRPVFENWSADCRVLTARFAPDLLEELLSAMLDEPLTGPIQFDLGMNLSDPSVRPVLRALTLVRNELNDPDGITSD
ncbi:cupin domain-containing protein [Amycolatopsis silviterrae]|uniref:Transcription regulator HTH AraC- type ligand binding domain-containing protein n=1 Tax=Amycolatopsis silviterrae TaxID=1656914 RepID=A0ABW5HBE5_9PSEU